MSLIRLQQEILEAADDASRKYYEETSEKERTGSGVTEVMRDVSPQIAYNNSKEYFLIFFELF